MEKEPLLISACLLGLACRYDGASRPLPRAQLDALSARWHLVPVCPEQLGGLATPRPPAERAGDKVLTRTGEDVTDSYRRGAEETLRLAQLLGCSRALLKERSPSCGHGEIYDGTFSGRLVPGSGVAGALLSAQGIAVLGESQIESLLK